MSWIEVTLGNEIELAYGKALPAHTRTAGQVPVFGSNGCVGYHSSSMVSGPGIIVGRKGSVGEVVFSENDFWPIDTTYFVVNKKGYHWRYLHYLLSSLGLKYLNSHSAVPGLNREDVHSITTRVPSKPEQKEIAYVLDAVDLGIQLETKALEQSQSLKRATTHRLFTKGLRGGPQKETEIGLIPESWELKSLASVSSKPDYGFTASASNQQVGPKFLRITDIQDGDVDWDRVPFCKYNLKDLTSKTLSKDDIVVARIGATTGKAFIIGECPQSVFASYLIRIRTDKATLSPAFLYYYMQTANYWHHIDQHKGGKLKGGVNIPILSSLTIPVPTTLEEQKEIVSILVTIDQKISLHKRKKALLEELFKSLLHKLMTGEIRGTDLNLSALDQSATSQGAIA